MFTANIWGSVTLRYNRQGVVVVINIFQVALYMGSYYETRFNRSLLILIKTEPLSLGRIVVAFDICLVVIYLLGDYLLMHTIQSSCQHDGPN